LYKILGVLDGVANKIDRAAEFDDRSKREHLTELRRLNSLSRDVIADAIFGPRAPGQAHWNSRPVAPPEPHA
jgi:hypothetical protein